MKERNKKIDETVKEMKKITTDFSRKKESVGFWDSVKDYIKEKAETEKRNRVQQQQLIERQYFIMAVEEITKELGMALATSQIPHLPQLNEAALGIDNCWFDNKNIYVRYKVFGSDSTYVNSFGMDKMLNDMNRCLHVFRNRTFEKMGCYMLDAYPFITHGIRVVDITYAEPIYIFTITAVRL